MAGAEPCSRSRSVRNEKAMNHSLPEYEPDRTVTPDEYQPYIGKQGVDRLKRLADSVSGKSWASLSSTFQGGGVAEMLHSVIPLVKSMGIDASWAVIEGPQEFFQVTKKFHNLLQGVEQPITLGELFEQYLGTIEANAKKTNIAADMIVVHDPQPIGLTASGSFFGNVLWRCHIDTSTPNPTLWRFVLPYINQCAGAIFTQPEFVGAGLNVPVYQIAPCIDPLVDKNQLYNQRDALATLDRLFTEHNVDPGRPILAAISRYDIHKNQGTVLEAFRKLREERTYATPPYLIFLGNTAPDDPEGEGMLASLREQAGDDPDVRFWVNVPDNDRVVGALMHLARSFIHIPTREGFGLVVTEALWQGTPVVGSNVGGVIKQVVDGKTGYVVDPKNVEATASRMARVLDDPEEAEALGKGGREHVRQNFLLPELVSRYLTLLHYYSGVSDTLPPFRLDSVAHNEIAQALRPSHPHVPTPLVDGDLTRLRDIRSAATSSESPVAGD